MVGGCLNVKQDLGLKCSAWKVFGSKDFGLVGLYQKTKLDLFGSKKFGSENFLSQKNFWSKENFVPKKCWSKSKFFVKHNFWVQKSFWVQKTFWVQKKFLVLKKFLNPKKYWVQKILGPKNIFKEFLVQKNLYLKKFWV